MVAHPGPPQIRACTSRAPGSSSHEFATRASVVVTWTWFRSQCTWHVSLQRLMRRHLLSGGALAHTLGSGGNSTHFKVGLSPAPMATFPAAPPKIPYGGFSPVRLQVPGTAQFSRESSRVGRWLKCDPHIRHLPTQLALAFGIASAGRDPPQCAGLQGLTTPPGPRGPRSGEFFMASPSSLADLIRQSGFLRSISQQSRL